MKKIVKFLGFLCLLLTLSFVHAGEKTIVIDIGHGGKDSGSEINGVLEKDLTFEIAKKIRALNSDPNIKIIFTRQADDFVSLQDRVDYINSLTPDLVISLHLNFSEDTRDNGFDIFVSAKEKRSEDSRLLAENLERALSGRISSNGIKEANFYLLRNLDFPSATIELGYLSNPRNRDFLISEDGQHKLAEAIYNAIK